MFVPANNMISIFLYFFYYIVRLLNMYSPILSEAYVYYCYISSELDKQENLDLTIQQGWLRKCDKKHIKNVKIACVNIADDEINLI